MMPCRIFPDRSHSVPKICTGSLAYSDYKVRSLRGTTLASKEWTNGRLYPRCRGTTKLVPRAGRGAKKSFSKNEVLTRTHFLYTLSDSLLMIVFITIKSGLVPLIKGL